MKRLISMFGLLAILLMIVSACAAPAAAPSGNSSVTALPATEVREYQGEKLDSTSVFRENSIKGFQTIDINTYKLELTGLISQPRSYTYDEVIAHPNFSKVVTLHCVEGWDAKVLWQGVRLNDLFSEAGVNDQANTVILYAYDGYSTSLPLDYIRNNNILLAHKINDVTLPPVRGYPFQLVAEDKWGYKWIKWVTKIELSDNPNYQGYWEQRGYDNQGDYGKPF
jgi:DMSO/TMAO reductase YedYZ molybdopterin-dependent catalytic subunit